MGYNLALTDWLRPVDSAVCERAVEVTNCSIIAAKYAPWSATRRTGGLLSPETRKLAGADMKLSLTANCEYDDT